MKCLFCGKEKEREYINGGWLSDIWIMVGNKILNKATVCPNCRKKKKIEDIYRKITDEAIKEMKNEMSEMQKG